jgi:hypothetical protein
VDAVAFTAGSDIFFRAGAYAPDTADGRHLLAHEAVHVVQQAAGPVAGTPAPGGMSISDPHDRLEQEAERAARVVVGDSSPTAEVAATQAVSRDRDARSSLPPGTGQIMRYIERREPWGAAYVPDWLDRSWVRLDPILVEVSEGGAAPTVPHVFSHEDETTTLNVRAGSSGTIRVRMHVTYPLTIPRHTHA